MQHAGAFDVAFHRAFQRIDLSPQTFQAIEELLLFRRDWGSVTLDYQHIANPGYNRDRSPANIFALRLHAGF